MSMNSARWRTRDIDLMKFFLDATAVASWQFEPSEEDGRQSKIGLVLNRDRVLTGYVELAPRAGRVMEQNGFQKERDVAKSGLCSTINREAFRSFKFAVNERNVDLKSETVVDRVAGNDLCDRTVFVLTGRIRPFASVDLEGAEISELLGDGNVASRYPRCRCNGLDIRHRFDLRSVAAAKIAGATRVAGHHNKTCAEKRNNFGAMDTESHRNQRIDAITRTSN